MSWSNESSFIASGGDDCRYKIWDNQGSVVYASSIEDHSISSVEFCPKGVFLAVGGFNTLKLCHYTGVSEFCLNIFVFITRVIMFVFYSGLIATQNLVNRLLVHYITFVGHKMELK